MPFPPGGHCLIIIFIFYFWKQEKKIIFILFFFNVCQVRTRDKILKQLSTSEWFLTNHFYSANSFFFLIVLFLYIEQFTCNTFVQVNQAFTIQIKKSVWILRISTYHYLYCLHRIMLMAISLGNTGSCLIKVKRC